MNEPIRQAKRSARKNMKAAIAAVPAERRSAWSAGIAEHVTALPEWKDCKTVLAFLPMQGEVDTTGVLERALLENKILAVPRMYAEDIRFHRIESTAGPWENHPYGVREPPATFPVVDPCAEESGEVLVITPGLCFDCRGGRLGFGKGYYDRVLKRCRRERPGQVFFAAVGFAIQLIDKVPRDAHDCMVDAIVTERGVEFRCGA